MDAIRRTTINATLQSISCLSTDCIRTEANQVNLVLQIEWSVAGACALCK